MKAARSAVSPLAHTRATSAEEFLLSEDVAELLGVSRSTVQEWLGRCRIPHRKMPFTRRCIIVRADFEAWLDGAELETVRLAGGGRIVRPKRGR
jgi:excisionase family DNA binding protein